MVCGAAGGRRNANEPQGVRNWDFSGWRLVGGQLVGVMAETGQPQRVCAKGQQQHWQGIGSIGRDTRAGPAGAHRLSSRLNSSPRGTWASPVLHPIHARLTLWSARGLAPASHRSPLNRDTDCSDAADGQHSHGQAFACIPRCTTSPPRPPPLRADPVIRIALRGACARNVEKRGRLGLGCKVGVQVGCCVWLSNHTRPHQPPTRPGRVEFFHPSLFVLTDFDLCAQPQRPGCALSKLGTCRCRASQSPPTRQQRASAGPLGNQRCSGISRVSRLVRLALSISAIPALAIACCLL